MVVSDVEWDKRKHDGEYDLVYTSHDLGGEIARNALAEFNLRQGVNEIEYEVQKALGMEEIETEAEVEVYDKWTMVYAENEAEEYLDNVLSQI